MSNRNAKKKRPSRRKCTAYHEAGHTVAALMLGLEFTYVTIRPDEESVGRIKYKRTRRRTDFISLFDFCARNNIEKTLIAGLAGVVAARGLTGEYDWQTASADEEGCRDLIRGTSGSEATHKLYYDYVMSLTQDVVAGPASWIQVERLASALLKRGRLSYQEAKDIFDLPRTPREVRRSRKRFAERT